MPALTRLSGRPLLDNASDRLLFVGRDEEFRTLQRGIQNNLNCLVLGPPGSGKTSVLHPLSLDARGRGLAVIRVDGNLATDVRSLVELIRGQLVREPSLPSEWRAMVTALADTRPASELERLADVLGSLAPSDQQLALRRPLIVLDNVPSAEIGHTLFGRLRDELWTLPFTWLVAADERFRLTFLAPPADAFFEIVVTLGPLSVQAIADLLGRRIDDPSLGWLIEEVSRSSDRQPGAAIRLARNAIASDKQPHEITAERAAFEAKLDQLGPSARALVQQLEQFGPMSASDENLLNRLHWSRVRANQVFRELEAAGMVTSTLQAVDAAGRPRKIYGLENRL